MQSDDDSTIGEFHTEVGAPLEPTTSTQVSSTSANTSLQQHQATTVGFSEKKLQNFWITKDRLKLEPYFE